MMRRAGRRALLGAGANDFGGVSPVTKDYVNPEKPWPARRQRWRPPPPRPAWRSSQGAYDL